MYKRRTKLSFQAFVPWLQVQRPIDWEKRFCRTAPLEVEIGFGNGEHLVQRAHGHQERDFVGIDLDWDSIQKTLRKIQRADLKNVRLIQADAVTAFDRLFQPASIHWVYALFPVPWPKVKQAKNRLFSNAFLKLLNSRLVPQGKARIVTDYEPYLHWILEQIPDSGLEAKWELVPPRFGTKYENKWRQRGQMQFYELRLLKCKHEEIPTKEDMALITHRVEHFDPERFRPMGHRNDIIVSFKEFLFDPRRQKGMVRVVVVEGSLTQCFWIEIVNTEGGWDIRLAQGCGAVSTAGLRDALDLVREAALLSQSRPL